MKNKHLSFNDRLEIEKGLNENLSFKKIGIIIEKDCTTISEKIHIYEFIKRIIIHIHEKGFKTIRYYEFYFKHHKQEKHYTRMLSQEQCKMRKQFTTWRLMALKAFQEDPYKCKKCNKIMKLCFCFRPGEVFF